MVMKKRIISLIATAAMLVCTTDSFSASLNVSSEASEWKFDFGGNGTASGYTGVSASDAYNASNGYGFNKTSAVKNVSASGSGALSDAVQFTEYGSDSTNTFNVDLPVGLYEISVVLGNTSSNTNIAAEGVPQLINLTGNNATNKFKIPVTDGQLNILATEGINAFSFGFGSSAFTLSTLEIKKLSDDPTMPQTIWICGDSTICDYYPLETSVQTGWGQVLNQYTDIDIRNLASSGQTATGYISAKAFDTVMKYIKKGDYYLIAIGINDSFFGKESDYYAAVSDMTKKVKEKGAEVILIKQQGLADDIVTNPNITEKWFGSTLDKIGREQSVKVCDLFNLSFAYWKSIGATATRAQFISTDTIHPNRTGAIELARLFASDVELVKTVEVTTTTTTTSETTTSTFEEIKYLYGDVNLDGIVTPSDLMPFIAHFLNIPLQGTALLVADVNGDGSVDISDLATLKQYCVGDTVPNVGKPLK